MLYHPFFKIFIIILSLEYEAFSSCWENNNEEIVDTIKITLRNSIKICNISIFCPCLNFSRVDTNDIRENIILEYKEDNTFLPSEILGFIYNYLNPIEILKLSHVNSFFREAVEENKIWEVWKIKYNLNRERFDKNPSKTVIAHYYYLKGLQEKNIIYFKKAGKLNHYQANLLLNKIKINEINRFNAQLAKGIQDFSSTQIHLFFQ